MQPFSVPLGSGRVGSDDLGYRPGSGFSFEPVQTSNTHTHTHTHTYIYIYIYIYIYMCVFIFSGNLFKKVKLSHILDSLHVK